MPVATSEHTRHCSCPATTGTTSGLPMYRKSIYIRTHLYIESQLTSEHTWHCSCPATTGTTSGSPVYRKSIDIRTHCSCPATSGTTSGLPVYIESQSTSKHTAPVLLQLAPSLVYLYNFFLRMHILMNFNLRSESLREKESKI